MKPFHGPLMSLGNAAKNRVRLIVWCKDCRHQVEPDVSAQAARYGTETAVVEWKKRLICGKCGRTSTQWRPANAATGIQQIKRPARQRATSTRTFTTRV